MELFYKFNRKYNLNDCKVQLENVQIIELNLDDYENERKPEKFKYFKEPKSTAYPLNLNKGYENHIFRKMNVIYGKTLNKVLKWDIKCNISKSHCNSKESFNVYTHRSAIIFILKSHFNKGYSRHLDWNLYATKFGANLFIYCENDGNRCELESINIKRAYYSKLEQLLFSDSPNNEPNTDEPVDENIRLNGIYRCQLGKFNLIYSAEVQGIISDEEIKDLNNMDLLNKYRFVNTKVTYKRKFNNNLFNMQIYFQNCLVNVGVTYFAFRDNNGYVHEPIKPTKTSDMCKVISWNSKEYEQFLYDFLSLIVEKMSGVNCLETTYEFKYRSENKAVFYTVHKGRTDKSFLPDDYIKLMKQNN